MSAWARSMMAFIDLARMRMAVFAGRGLCGVKMVESRSQ
jgi:hypothetical protein